MLSGSGHPFGVSNGSGGSGSGNGREPPALPPRGIARGSAPPAPPAGGRKVPPEVPPKRSSLSNLALYDNVRSKCHVVMHSFFKVSRRRHVQCAAADKLFRRCYTQISWIVVCKSAPFTCRAAQTHYHDATDWAVIMEEGAVT